MKHLKLTGPANKIKLLKQKLYNLYDQKLRSCEERLNTELVDHDINKLEKQIQDLQTEMWE